jgi:LacI family transcriptional regulator
MSERKETSARPPRTAGARLVDVARLAGVHSSTVSSVLNDSRTNTRVSEATRQRILTAAAELRYVPNSLAQGLRRQRTGTLGVVFEGLSLAKTEMVLRNPYLVEVLNGVLAAAMQAGYSITLVTRPWRDAHHSATSYLGQGMDGVLILAPTPESDIVEGLSAVGLPLVVISGRGVGMQDVFAVGVDNATGVRLAITHLIAHGHQRIAFVADGLSQLDAIERREAYCAEMSAHGLPVLPGYLVESNYQPGQFYTHTQTLLALEMPPTAICTVNDAVAFEVLRAARDAGLSVPAELSIVGFDDYPASAITWPPLTTVRQSSAAIGRLATERLIALVEDNTPPGEDYFFAPELIVRKTTAPYIGSESLSHSPH